MRRTQILLEPEQYAALSEIAQLEDRSLSDLLRETVDALIQERKIRQIEKAALALLADYQTEKDLTAFSSLDSQEFYAQG